MTAFKNDSTPSRLYGTFRCLHPTLCARLSTQVYSEGTESSVVIQGSTLMGPSLCGGSAMAVVNGHISVIDSTLTGSHDQVGYLLPLDERDHPLRVRSPCYRDRLSLKSPESSLELLFCLYI